MDKMELKETRKIGHYLTEKKSARMNWAEFGNVCRNRGFTLVKINLYESLEVQGPFFAIILKMTEVIFKSSMGDKEAKSALENLKSYIKAHPEVIVIDPLDSVLALMDRLRCCEIVKNCGLDEDKVFSPAFVELTSLDVEENIQRLKDAGVTYPFVCKPSCSHGSHAHQMAVVFNEEGVADCKPPCVAQSFIIHNAVLYKIYVVGKNFTVTERPSLKNFKASDDKTVFFTTSDVSKSDSTSSLTVLDPEDAAVAPPSNPDVQCLQHIVNTLRRELGMMLLGIDVVIEHKSGRYGIIDVNVFPSYDKFPNFFECLLDNVTEMASFKNFKTVESLKQPPEDTENFLPPKNLCEFQQIHQSSLKASHLFLAHSSLSTESTSEKTINREGDQDDSGFDTGDSSDERKKKWCSGGGNHGRKLPQQIKVFPAPSQHPSSNINESMCRAGVGES